MKKRNYWKYDATTALSFINRSYRRERMLFPYIALAGRIVLLGYERIIIKKLGSHQTSLGSTFWYFFLGTIILTPTLMLESWPTSWDFLWLALISAVLTTSTFWLYVKSLAEGEASQVTPLLNMNAFFVLVLAWFFLSETITLWKVLGIGVIIYGLAFIGNHGHLLDSLKAILHNKPCRYMLAASFFLAIGRTIDAYAARNVPPLTYGWFMFVFTTLIILILEFPAHAIKKTIILLKKRPFLAIGAGACNAFTFLFFLVAVRYFELSIIEPVVMFSTVITVLLASQVLHENIKDRLKGVVIMVIGAWLLFL